MSTIHENIVQRCTNPKATSYRHYGGRGISVCDRWRHGDGGMSGAECFRADMGPCPRGLTLDRLNNDGNYEPSNCRWATREEQGRNRRKRDPSPPRPYPFQMRATDEWWRGVDDWCRLQPDMPNRAEAIRRLVAIGLRADPPTQRLAPVKGRTKE